MTELDSILVTGGSSGIGASLVRHLAGDYEVLTVARRIDRMNRAHADEEHVHPYELDLADPDGIADLLDDLLVEHGPIPYLIHCAGTWNPKPVTERPDDMFAETREAKS